MARRAESFTFDATRAILNSILHLRSETSRAQFAAPIIGRNQLLFFLPLRIDISIGKHTNKHTHAEEVRSLFCLHTHA
jgi:hypothetical protein